MAAPTRVPLWRDVRVLRWVVQIAIVGAVVAFLAWLYGNYLDQTREQNIPTNFDFLSNPASFQITGNSLSRNAPVRKALVEGLLNTLRVSVAGVVAATVLGTLIGIGRLSHNWVVRKLATVYVEGGRNIPLPVFRVAGPAVLVGLVGTGRLCHNWVVRKLATVYVEGVRNIPLPVFLVAGFSAVVLGVFPPITDAWDLPGLVVSNRGVAVAWYVGPGL